MTNVAINGFGRMGRLALRAAWDRDDLRFVHVNEPEGGSRTAAHLLTFDSVRGRWDRGARGQDGALVIDDTPITFTGAAESGAVAWDQSGVDVVLECSGRFRTVAQLEPHLVSVDCRDDPRSSIVDALSTRVTDGTQVKVLAWYDNEWGYANRMAELAGIVAASLTPA